MNKQKLKGLLLILPWREIVIMTLGTIVISLIYLGFIDKNSRVVSLVNETLSSHMGIPMDELIDLETPDDLSKKVDCCKDCHES